MLSLPIVSAEDCLVFENNRIVLGFTVKRFWVFSPMDVSSWIRRSLWRGGKKTQNRDQRTQSLKEEEEEEELGVTSQLVDYVKFFTLDTFKSYPLQDNDETSTTVYDDENSATNSSANVRKDLSDWQARHAMHVLSKVKELSRLRFTLCPGHLKEQQFWKIYFKLVRNHVAEYELRAIQRAKIRRMAMENEKDSETIMFEVEMSETKHAANLAPSTP